MNTSQAYKLEIKFSLHQLI